MEANCVAHCFSVTIFKEKIDAIYLDIHPPRFRLNEIFGNVLLSEFVASGTQYTNDRLKNSSSQWMDIFFDSPSL